MSNMWKINAMNLAFNQESDEEFDKFIDLINALRSKNVDEFKKINLENISTNVVVSWIVNTNSFNFVTENGFDWIRENSIDNISPISYLSSQDFKFLYGSYVDPRDDQVKFSYKKFWSNINKEVLNNNLKSTDIVNFNSRSGSIESLNLINYCALRHSNILFYINKTEQEKNEAMIYLVKSFNDIFKYSNDEIDENKIVEIFNELKTNSFVINSFDECLEILISLNKVFLHKIRNSNYSEIIINELYLNLLEDCIEYIKEDNSVLYSFAENLNHDTLPYFTINLILDKINEDLGSDDVINLLNNFIKNIIDNDLSFKNLSCIRLSDLDGVLISEDIMKDLCTYSANKIDGGNNLFIKDLVSFLNENEDFIPNDYKGFSSKLNGERDSLKLIGVLLSKGNNKLASKRKM